jgi:AAA+ ATPase superfamily predicted ATPase
LENDYAVIAKHKPIDARPNSRLQKYKVVDNFLNFWFRFIYRNRSALETGNFEYVKQIINRDYSVYSGRILEIFFQQLFADSGRYNRVGSYWEKGNVNEIDLVAINDMKKEIIIAEVKYNESKIRLEGLKNKSKNILSVYPEFTPQWLALGIEDVKDYID